MKNSTTRKILSLAFVLLSGAAMGEHATSKGVTVYHRTVVVGRPAAGVTVSGTATWNSYPWYGGYPTTTTYPTTPTYYPSYPTTPAPYPYPTYTYPSTGCNTTIYNPYTYASTYPTTYPSTYYPSSYGTVYPSYYSSTYPTYPTYPSCSSSYYKPPYPYPTYGYYPYSSGSGTYSTPYSSGQFSYTRSPYYGSFSATNSYGGYINATRSPSGILINGAGPRGSINVSINPW